MQVAEVPLDMQASSAPQTVVLDARRRGAYRKGHIPGAQNVQWTRYRAGWLRSGRLRDDLESLARDLGQLGVGDDRRVLVCGSARDGWGEEGRIAWMVRYLGHPAVAILDGGCKAWREAGRPFTRTATPPRAGTFTPRLNEDLRAFTPDVIAALADANVQLLDVRSPEEYAGATPYYSSRGGHIPTAVNLPFLRLLDVRGRIRKAHELTAMLRALGLFSDQRFIVYCTGGVRSAFAAEMLRELGISAANYDASYWAWSADDSLPVTTRNG